MELSSPHERRNEDKIEIEERRRKGRTKKRLSYMWTSTNSCAKNLLAGFGFMANFEIHKTLFGFSKILLENRRKFTNSLEENKIAAYCLRK